MFTTSHHDTTKQRSAAMRHRLATRTIVVFILNLFITFSALLQTSDARSTRRIRSRFNGGIPSMRSCGSSMVDAMRFICQLELWRTKMCVEAKRRFCENRQFPIYPICRFDCAERTSQDGHDDLASDDMQMNGADVTPIIDGVLDYLSSRIGQVNQERRRSRVQERCKMRSLAMRCCRRKCSIDVLRDFCIGTLSN